jgi:hypothetical protein
MRLLILLTAALAQDLLTEAQIEIRNRLREPESAQFDNLRAAEKTLNEKKVQVVCGNVTAKNSTGQLSGPSPFVFLGETRESWLARNHDILKDSSKDQERCTSLPNGARDPTGTRPSVGRICKTSGCLNRAVEL